MKKNIFLLLLFIAVIPSFDAQTRLTVHPDFAKYGNDHQTIAVIPFKTTISLRPKQMKNLKEGQLEKMQEDEGIHIQHAMYAWFLKRRQQGKMWVDVQDASTTNSLLAKKGITYNNVSTYTSQEIAEILEVDAIIRGTFETNKPMSEGASVAIGVLFGFYGATNQATINMFIHNGVDSRSLVNYHKMVAGSVGSTTEQLINVLMRKASRRIPYTKPKEE